MIQRLTLGQLATLVQQTLDLHFKDHSFWVQAEAVDVRKQESRQWCWCRLVEKNGSQINAQMDAVFWNAGYQHILRFERVTGKRFESGLSISCRVVVKFHPRYGLKLEVVELDEGFTLGQLEMERRRTLERLLTEYPVQITQTDGQYITFNNQLKLPAVLQRIALITAPNSDGQQDFMKELAKNSYQYDFAVTGFLTTMQGQQAAANIVAQLQAIRMQAADFDAVAIVRGGGSDADFQPFDDFELAKTIALYPLPIFTGIGHDRNLTIADLMARYLKTPTKVAATFIDYNFRFENAILELQQNLEATVQTKLVNAEKGLAQARQLLHWRVPALVANRKQGLLLSHTRLRHARHTLAHKNQQVSHLAQKLQGASQQCLKTWGQRVMLQSRLVEQLSPQATLQRGFAILQQQQAIITSTAAILPHQPITAVLADGEAEMNIVKINPHNHAHL